MEVVGPRGASEQSLTASRLRLAAGLLFTLAVAAFLTAVVASGEFFLTQTELGGQTWLRCTLTHPATELDDLRGLLEALRARA